MFVGFIAVVVILLVVVGLMSTGATNGSGGVDQTKATKALSEISALVQSAGFYKTTTANSNYDGITVVGLYDAGIVAAGDLVEDDASNTNANAVDTDLSLVIDDLGATPIDTDILIKSKAVQGLFYEIAAGDTVNDFTFNVMADTAALTPGLKKALEANYSKFDDSAVTAATNTTAESGTATIIFN